MNGNRLRLFNPTDEFVAALQAHPYIELDINPLSVELYERCPACHEIPPAGAYCVCDWMHETPAPLWTIGNTLHSYPPEWDEPKDCTCWVNNPEAHWSLHDLECPCNGIK